MTQPTICFGQQPCGFFPKRFLVAKINTARALQKEIGGRIVFFYHDSDADYHETITLMRDVITGAEVRLNFTQENKLQKKFSPLYAKRIPAGWKEEILKQLPRFVPVPPPSPRGGGIKGEGAVDIFKSVDKKFVGDFCLEIYQKMGLLDGVDVVRSSDVNFREKALDLDKDYFADVQYMGEVVRAKIEPSSVVARFIDPPRRTDESGNYTTNDLTPTLHEGGGKYIQVPMPEKIEKKQKSASRDARFAWMNSVIGATHYIYGEGEKAYLKTEEFPEVKFIDREKIDSPSFAWLHS